MKESKNSFTPEKKLETIEKIIGLVEKEYEDTIKDFRTINCIGLLMRCILYDSIKIVNERFTENKVIKEPIKENLPIEINKEENMEQTLQINDQQLMIKEYNNQRVVTMWDIAKVHGTTTNNVRINFKNNKKHLIEGEDYFLVEKQSEFASNLICSRDLSQKVLNAAKDIPIFTESGYLLMTKPMTDDRSWQVQRTLINSYFKVNESPKSEIAKIKEPLKLQDLSEINKTIELMDSMFKTSRISDREKMILVSSLLETAGVELPEINLSEPVNKANYIALEELTVRVGLYREDKTPNVEAAMAFIRDIGLTLEDMNLRLRTSDNGGYWFSIKFNPHFVERISRYLYKEKYPSVIDCKQMDGSIIRIPVYYYQYSKTVI